MRIGIIGNADHGKASIEAAKERGLVIIGNDKEMEAFSILNPCAHSDLEKTFNWNRKRNNIVMRKQSLRALAGIYALTVMGSEFLNQDYDLDQIQRDPLNNKPRPVKKIIPKGLKRFTFGDNELYAMNEKVANKKAKKRGWI